MYENPRVVLSISKEFSTVIRRSKELLRVMIIIEMPRAKIKSVVSNHNLKEDQFNKIESCHQSQTDKRHQCLSVFKHASSVIFKTAS